MSLTIEEWHKRYKQQARWTRDLRDTLLPRLDFRTLPSILAIGCGTGAVIEDLVERTSGSIYGGDIDIQALNMAMRNVPRAIYFAGDGLQLPFPDNTFDLSLNHYYLLWVEDPLQAVQEMARVTRSGGAVLALAEPDYGGRIDHPPPLDSIREPQISALRRQGADPFLGRKLQELFHRSGLQAVNTGVFQGHWSGQTEEVDENLEWRVLKEDLEPNLSPAELERLRRADHEARRAKRRVLFLPTFYAWGFV